MNKIRLLIVDDEIELCNRIKSSLEARLDNYIIFTEYSGIEALSIIKKEDIDVMVLDIRMPAISGIEIIRKANEMGRDIQSIILTGHGDLDHAIEAMRIGAANFFKKPVSADALHYAVLNAWQKRQANIMLRKSEARYRAMFDHMNEGVAIYRAVNNGEDFIFVDFNRAGGQIDCVKQENVIGKSVLEVFPGVKEFNLFSVFQRVWKTGNPEYHPISQYTDKRLIGWRENYVYKLPDGDIVAIYRDETPRKQAEEALKESEYRYRKLFDGASDAIFVHEFGKSFLDINKAACERLGYTREELLKMSIWDITSKECRHSIKSRIETLRQNGYIIFESTQITKSGEIIPVECNSRVIRYAGKMVILNISRDIRERKQAEEERQKLEFQLRQAQKMEAIGTLAGGIAHDFNNILFPIMGYTEMTIDELPKNSPLINNLNQVLNSANRAKDLVRQILTFSRQGEEERKPLKIQFVIKETLKLLRASIPTTIQISQNINEKCRNILADPTQIHQIVMNLCTNAFHAMEEEGGVLEVGLDEISLDLDDIKIFSDMVPGDYIKLSVTDTGHGMTPEVMEKIYNPYFTTKEKTKGTGLGLSIVHGIVRACNGNIKVYSEVGKGTSFHIYLPIAPESSTPLPPEGGERGGLRGGNERILLVDDELQIAEMLNYTLQNMGYNVTVRTSSIEALEWFRSHLDEVDLIITDLTMPNMTGIELSKTILKLSPNIPIILCTGFSEIITKQKAEAIGIKQFVMKPVVRSEIAKIIRRVLDNKIMK